MYKLLSKLYLVAICLCLFILFCINLGAQRSVDTVALYSLQPFSMAFNKIYLDDKAPRPNQVILTGNTLSNVCLLPNMMATIGSALLGGQIDGLGLDAATVKTLAATAGDREKNAKAVFNSLGNPFYQQAAVLLTQYQGRAGALPPVCKCLDRVLTIYRDNSSKTVEAVSQAMDACLSTEVHTRRHALFANNETSDNVVQQKSVSRFALLLSLCMALVINLAYSNIDFSKVDDYYSSNWVQFLFILLGVICTLVLPYATLSHLDGMNLFKIMLLWFMPKIILAVSTEIYWYNKAKKKDRHRQDLMNPMTFYITISDLFVLSLLENGVFTLQIVIAYILCSFGLSLVYSAILFLSHSSIKENFNSQIQQADFIIANMLLNITAAFVILWGLLPSFSIHCELQVLWLLPGLFCLITFGSVLYSDKYDKPKILDRINSPMDVAYFCILLVVVIYYVRELQLPTYLY